jgi:hypothetical protein
MATTFSDYVSSNERDINKNDLIIRKIKNAGSSSSSANSADALITSIYSNIKAFEKEAIMAGREYSNRKMNQCISVTVYGISLMDEIKTLIVFAFLTYLAFVIRKIARKFPEKA